MVPEDDSTKGDPNENITDGHGNLATGWCWNRVDRTVQWEGAITYTI